MGSHRRVQEVRGGSLAFDLLPRDAMEIGSAYDRSGGHTERRLSYRIQEADGPSELVPDLMLPVQFIELALLLRKHLRRSRARGRVDPPAAPSLPRQPDIHPPADVA